MSNGADKKVAVIKVGASDHLVRIGQKLTADRLKVAAGQEIEVNDKLTNQKVILKVLSHLRGPKINGLKFKNKVRYLRRYGHRQELTALEVVTIGAKVTPVPAEKTPTKTTVTKKSVAKKVPAAKTKKVSKND